MERAAIERLAAAGRPTERVVYHAPADGVVVELGVREGGLAEPGMAAIALAPLDPLWVVAAVPEAQAARVGPDAETTVTFPALPGERFSGRVIEKLPALDEMTRTVQVRLAVANPAGRLGAGMRANVLFETGGREDLLLAPAEAVIRTGRADRVIVALGGGRFAAREVVTGAEFGDEIEIRAGLDAGEQVVTSGQFMIDSESQVRESLRRLAAPPQDGATPPAATGEASAPGHEGHEAHSDQDAHAGHEGHQPSGAPEAHEGHDSHDHDHKQH
jgi:Cu(I)/Ag(I) efflux system membrane fusion protein